MSAIRGEILDMVGVYLMKLIFSHERCHFEYRQRKNKGICDRRN
jgi:hypothetical protein